VGQNLLEPIANGRVVEGWHGSPIEHAEIGILSLDDEALVFHASEKERSFVLQFKYDERNLIGHRFETRLGELDAAERRRWLSIIDQLDSSLVRLRMNELAEMLTP
jgi:hypothetical protein